MTMMVNANPRASDPCPIAPMIANAGPSWRWLHVACCLLILAGCGWDSRRQTWEGKRYPDQPPQKSDGCSDINVDDIIAQDLRWNAHKYSRVSAGEQLYPHFESIARTIVQQHGDQQYPTAQCRIISDHYLLKGIPLSPVPSRAHYVVDITIGPERRIADVCVTRNEYASDFDRGEERVRNTERSKRESPIPVLEVRTRKCFKSSELK